MDNLGSHKGKAVRQPSAPPAPSSSSCRPTAPDLNPIEQVFAKLKTLLRKAAERTIEATWRRIGTLLDCFTPRECANYLVNAGYASNVTNHALAPLRFPAAAHAGPAEGRARAALAARNRLDARSHLVERRQARAAPRRRGSGGGGILRGRIVDHRQFGRAQALELVAQARRFLEFEIGGGLAHARLEVGDHRLEIVPDGGGSSAMPPCVSIST